MMKIIYRAISYGCIQSKMKISRHTDVQTFTVTKHTHSQSCELTGHTYKHLQSQNVHTVNHVNHKIYVQMFTVTKHTVNHMNHKLYVQAFTVTRHTHSESCESQAIRTHIYSDKHSVKQSEIHKRLKGTPLFSYHKMQSILRCWGFTHFQRRNRQTMRNHTG